MQNGSIDNESNSVDSEYSGIKSSKKFYNSSLRCTNSINESGENSAIIKRKLD